MFSIESWNNFKRSILSLSSRGTRNQQYDIEGLLPIVNSCEEQLRDAKKGKKNKNPHHTPEDLTDAVVGGTVALIGVAKEINPEVELPPLEPNPNG